MRSQGVNLHSAFVYFDNLGGRAVTRTEMTDELIKRGCIEDNEEAFRRFQEEQCLAYMRRHRQSKARRGEIQLELVSLYRVNSKGEKKQYFKACGKLNPAESAQHIRYWEETVAEDVAQLDRYKEFHLGRHGKKLQKLLGFDDRADNNATPEEN